MADLHLEGVGALNRVTAGFDGADWRRPTCGVWSAEDTARHLLGVAEWYQEWMSRALDGDDTRPFAGSDIDHHNDNQVARHADLDGPAAMEAFLLAANAYLDCTNGYLDLPYSYPFGEVTVGLHLGVAATEWHLHAWDFARVAGCDYAPSDPASLYVAAGNCVAATKPFPISSLIRPMVRLGAKRKPWPTILRTSGRL